MLTLQESSMSNQTKVTRVSGGADWDVQDLVPGVIQTQCVQEWANAVCIVVTLPIVRRQQLDTKVTYPGRVNG